MKDMSVKELIIEVAYPNKFRIDIKPDLVRAELLRRFESLKCCGNCGAETRDCVYWKSDVGCNGYCSLWQSDGLSREEREGK